MSDGDKSCATDPCLQQPRLRMDFGSLWLGKRDGRRHAVGGACMRGGADVPLLACTPSRGTNLLLGKGQTPSPKASSRKVPEIPVSLPVSESHSNTFFFFHTRERGNKCETLSPTKRKGYRNVFWLISPPQPCASWLLSKS